MSKYLLNAPDEDMKRWKAQAEGEGLSFAAWIRQALDAASNNVALVPEAGGEYEFTYEIRDRQTKPFTEISMPRLNSFKPYPKPTKKKR